MPKFMYLRPTPSRVGPFGSELKACNGSMAEHPLDSDTFRARRPRDSGCLERPLVRPVSYTQNPFLRCSVLGRRASRPGHFYKNFSEKYTYTQVKKRVKQG
jgi:hypothetical protein